MKILSWLDFADFLPPNSSAKTASSWPEKLSLQDAAFLQRQPAKVNLPTHKLESTDKAANFLRACAESRVPTKRLIHALELSGFGRELSAGDFQAWLAAQGEQPTPAAAACFDARCTAPAQTSAPVEPASDGPAPAEPLQRQAAQEAAVLQKLNELGFNPISLPKNKPGKAGVKSKVRAALSKDRLFTGVKVFEKAWERLSASCEIVIKS